MRTYIGWTDGDTKNVIVIEGNLVNKLRPAPTYHGQTVPWKWGDQSPGCRQLCFCLLCSVTGNPLYAEAYARMLVEDVFCFMEKDSWICTSDDIEHWIQRVRELAEQLGHMDDVIDLGLQGGSDVPF